MAAEAHWTPARRLSCQARSCVCLAARCGIRRSGITIVLPQSACRDLALSCASGASYNADIGSGTATHRGDWRRCRPVDCGHRPRRAPAVTVAPDRVVSAGCRPRRGRQRAAARPGATSTRRRARLAVPGAALPAAPGARCWKRRALREVRRRACHRTMCGQRWQGALTCAVRCGGRKPWSKFSHAPSLGAVSARPPPGVARASLGRGAHPPRCVIHPTTCNLLLSVRFTNIVIFVAT